MLPLMGYLPDSGDSAVVAAADDGGTNKVPGTVVVGKIPAAAVAGVFVVFVVVLPLALVNRSRLAMLRTLCWFGCFMTESHSVSPI